MKGLRFGGAELPIWALDKPSTRGHSERTVASMGNVQEGRVLGCNNGR